MIFSAGVSQGIKSCFSSPPSGIIQYIKAETPWLWPSSLRAAFGIRWSRGGRKGGRRQPPGSITFLSNTGKMNYSRKAGSSSDEFCTAELVELYEIEFGIWETFKTRWSVCMVGSAWPQGGGNLRCLVGEATCSQTSEVGDKSSHPACLRATCTLQGETFCCQPEVQRGEVACLGPHSELVTMATCYLFVPCPAENGFRASPSPLPLRTSGETSSSWEFTPSLAPALDHWLDTHRLIAVWPGASSVTSLGLSFLMEKSRCAKTLVLVASLSAMNDRNAIQSGLSKK